MAMTAQQYLATLPAEEQAQVNASLKQSGSSLQQWYQAAIDAGDPRAVKASGGQVIEGGGGYGASETGGAPTAEWLGKRKPTPSELIRYYKETGKSEDFKRFSAAQVADWINRKWDAANGYFTNDFGDIVEKPTESGPQSHAAGYATGEMDAGKGGGGGAPKPAAAAPATPAAPEAPVDPLQAALVAQFQGREGQFGSGQQGTELGQGGIFWTSPTAAPVGRGAPGESGPGTGVQVGAPKTATGPMTRGGTPDPGSMVKGGAGGRPVPTGPVTNSANPALVSATLNAFSPAAVSGGGAAPHPVSTQWQMPATPEAVSTPWAGAADTAASSASGVLAKKLTPQFAGANRATDWWRQSA